MTTNENKTDTDNRLIQISIEMDELSRRIDHVDHKHESAWLHSLRTGGDTQDCLIRQRVALRRERSHLIKIQNSDAVIFGN